MGEADLGCKRLVSLAPDSWVRWVTGRGDVQAEEVVSADYEWLGRADDAVILASCPALGRFLVPIEVQLRPDSGMPSRMFAYAGLGAEKSRLPVYPVVIYLLPSQSEVVLESCYHSEFLGMVHHVDFATIRLWEVDANLAFGTGMEGLLPLVPLMRGGDTKTKVLEARQHLRADARLDDLEPLLAFLSSFVLGVAFVSEMEGWRMDIIMESPLFKELVRQREERAVRDVTCQHVLDVLVSRFGTVPAGITRRIQAIEDTAVLDRLVREAATAPSLSKFERAFDS